ncbi:hypothetical protein DLM46_36615 [Paraburkholderia lacunae]|uniref:Tn3 transposase DDE domain-containing protein n=1 Tax=Paraburkholderia lacunae TaxID=2211104 RepID=A0A370MWI7_9BURK|nr:hypothetical protein DLM46_36615 [Paraburkholderia lacunae]
MSRGDDKLLANATSYEGSAIHIDRVPLELARRRESLAGVSSALTLLPNILMAWNNAHVQRDIDARCGQPVEADRLRRITPTQTGGINLRGTFNFPVALYPERPLPNAAADNAIASTSHRA